MTETLRADRGKVINENGDSLRTLAEMSDKFDADGARRLAEASRVESPTAEMQNDAPIEARARVERAFEEKKRGEEESSIVEESIEQTDNQRAISAPKTISGRYESTERPRVDRIKSDLNSFNISEYEGEQIVSRPSAFKKAVRLIADRLGIKTKRSEERREREAMHVALSEHYEEEAARRKAVEEREKAEALEREIEEKKDLENDMATARDELDWQKKDRFEKQRIQEMVERDLNSRLLTVDSLETEVISENPEISKRFVSFEGVEIPVYDLDGIPFSMLSTTIDYRRKTEPGKIGTETFRKVLENPAVWAERRDEAEKASGFGTRDADARGDAISASYWNSERNINSHYSGDLIYGFGHVEGDSIITIVNGDGGTSNMAGRNETTLLDVDKIKKLEGADGTYGYNEVLLRRYTEDGAPKKPDYIIVENGRITKEALVHAKYFGVPIVNVERAVYEKKARIRGEELINSINMENSYEEMDRKIAELSSMSKYKRFYHSLDEIGLDIPRSMNLTSLDERCFEISKMEQIKRLDFIKCALEEATGKIEMATEKGVLTSELQALPQFDCFEVSIHDVHSQTCSTVLGDENESFYSSPGSCNWIEISFRLKGSSRNVKTKVYDGERWLEGWGVTKEGKENADSSFYDTLEPVVRKYFETFHKNEQLRHNTRRGFI